jgi:hypothetical protein
MAESFIQFPADGTGKKARTRLRTIGANSVHEQATFLAAADTWVAYADNAAFAANKQHISIFNATGSVKVVKVKKLFAVNLALVSVTGVAVRFDLKKITTSSAGTAVTPQSMDTTNAALPAQVTVTTGGTVTEGALLFPWITVNDEVGATNAFPTSVTQALGNIMMEGAETQELTLREGQGMTVKQITSTTVGTFGWILVFTIEDP